MGALVGIVWQIVGSCLGNGFKVRVIQGIL